MSTGDKAAISPQSMIEWSIVPPKNKFEQKKKKKPTRKTGSECNMIK